jgi:hypothetical protein
MIRAAVPDELCTSPNETVQDLDHPLRINLTTQRAATNPVRPLYQRKKGIR